MSKRPSCGEKRLVSRFGIAAAGAATLWMGGCGRIDIEVVARGGGGLSGAGGGGGAGAASGSTGSAGNWPEVHEAGSTVSVGNGHACAVRSGALFCWGSNGAGQLGTGQTGGGENRPVRVDQRRWASVVAGYGCTCGLLTDGHVLCWGDNTEGQLGQGDFDARPSPVEVALPGPAESVSLDSTHVCAILDDGSLWCWGNNFEGQLGQDDGFDAPPEPNPLRVGSDTDSVAVAAGEGHTCALRAPGTLWCWGRNTVGQLGLGTNDPIQTRVPQQTHPADDWVAVATGSHLSCGLRASHSASCFGSNPVGQALPGGPDPQLDPNATIAGPAGFTAIDAHVFHACGLDVEGHAWCWGRNEEGQLGTGAFSLSEPETRLGDAVFVTVATGRFATCTMSADDQVWCTGANNAGQLGLGDDVRRNVLTQLEFP